MEEGAQQDVAIGQPSSSRTANKKSRRAMQPEPEDEGGGEVEDKDEAKDRGEDEDKELLGRWRQHKVCNCLAGYIILISSQRRTAVLSLALRATPRKTHLCSLFHLLPSTCYSFHQTTSTLWLIRIR